MVIPRYHPVFGGAETQCRLLNHHLDRTGQICVAYLLTRRIEPSLARRERVDGVDVVRLGGPGVNRWREYEFYLRACAHLLRRPSSFDLIHCHATSVIGFFLTLVGWLVRRPVVLKLSSSGELVTGLTNYTSETQLDTSVRGRLRRPLARFTARHAYMVALNDVGMDELRLAGARRAVQINNGVDEDRFRPAAPAERRRLRERLGFADDEVVFVFTGRFVFKKGIDLLVTAFESLVRTPDMRRVRLALLGSGELQADAVSHLVHDRLEARAEWLRVFPPTDNVAPYLQAADAFVFPSRKEGMPNSVLEAMAVGLPCVLSDIRPHLELGRQNPNAPCWFFSSGSADSLQSALRACAEALPEGSVRGTAAGQVLDQRFRMPRVADSYVRLYKAALGRVRA